MEDVGIEPLLLLAKQMCSPPHSVPPSYRFVAGVVTPENSAERSRDGGIRTHDLRSPRAAR
jgi:hypothetical protein